jgi:outer membrane protein OmpU
MSARRPTMTRYLLATTALALAGAWEGAAYAQTNVEPLKLTVGGFFGQFVSYIDQDDVGAQANGSSGKVTQFDVSSDSEIHFNGRMGLANGLTLGFRVELEANTDADQIDESYLFLESRFGRLELGSINNVAYRMHYEAPEAFTRGWLTDDGNLTNNVVNPTGSPSLDSTLIGTQNRFFDNDSEKINYYTPRFSGFQFGVSYVPNSAQDRNAAPDPISTAYSRGLAAGANFVRTFGSFDVAASLGYLTWQGPQTSPTTSAPDPDAWQAGLQVGYAGLKVGGSYAEIRDGRSGSAGTAAAASQAGTGANRVDGRAWNLGAMYTFGPAAVSLTYADGRNDSSPAAGPSLGDDKFTGLSLAGKYSLGPGVSFEGVLFQTEFEGNGSTPAPNDNTATGLLFGLLLTF